MQLDYPVEPVDAFGDDDQIKRPFLEGQWQTLQQSKTADIASLVNGTP
ncbi:Hypothetical protein RAK1035_3298 [Roseovarius sp. AK1035]|nr:Hypothetical protein RAK1035_3298 [Roseovarius sp. AK1035]